MLTTQIKKGPDSAKSTTPTPSPNDVITGASTSADCPVLELQKNARERLRIMHTQYRGKPYIDLRIWYVDKTGNYVPSRNGVSIRPGHLAEVVRALTLAGREVSAVESA